VLKGALATALRRAAGLQNNAIISGSIVPSLQEIADEFDKVRFTHAFPVTAGARLRPVQPPLSLVQDQDDVTYDVALVSGPVLLGKPPRAPAFSIDWKDASNVFKELGWAEPPRELRVRTAIDSHRRKADDSQLFAYEMIIPNGYEWLGYLDLSRIDTAKLSQVEAQLRNLLGSKLLAIGKTKAGVQIDLITDTSVQPKFTSNTSTLSAVVAPQWVITLQTPAVLCDPSTIVETSGGNELRQAYADVWDKLSGQSLALVRFFASQSLMGGRYLVDRFQPARPYNPFLLTDAGSVFVVQAEPGSVSSAQAKIDAWLQHGLPLPDWAANRYRDAWNTCPFRAVDGFGEIAVNLPCHTKLKPSEAPFHAIP
jgi:hypothetical protein